MAFLCLVFFVCAAVLALGAFGSSSTRARAATGDTITSISLAPESDTTRFYNFETLGALKTESEIGGEAVGPRLIVTATYDNNPSLTERLDASAFTLTTEGGLKETDTLTTGQHTVIATLNSNAEISERCTIEVRDNEIVSISASYNSESAGEISSTTQISFLRRYITITGKYANGDSASNISNWSIEGDLAAPRDNTSDTYSKVVKIVYNDDTYVKPYELTITNIRAQTPQNIWLATSSEVSYGAGTQFNPSEAAFDFTIMYSTGVITLRYSASDTRFSFSYTNEEGEAIRDEDGNVKPGMEAYADKDAFEYYSTTNNGDYLIIYYTESGETVECQIYVNVFKSAHSIVILNSDGKTYRPGQTTSGLTYNYDKSGDNAATGKAHSFDLDNTGYEFDPEIMKISVSGNREGGEAINSGIEIVEAASKQTGEVRLTEAGTYTVTVALTNPGYYWSGYEESVSELSFTVIIEKAELGDLSVSVGHTTYDDSEVQNPGWTYGDDFQEGWVTYKGNYGGGDVEWHYSGRLNAGTDYSDNAQAPTDAGSYKVYVDISETDNFKAGSTSAKPAEFIVGKQEIKPTLSDLGHNILQTKTYAGTPLTAEEVESELYYISENAQNAQNVGTYSVTLKMTDSYNYRWDTPAGDVGSDAFANREVLFEIVAKQVTRPRSEFTGTYSGKVQTIDLNLEGTIGEGSKDAFQALVKGTATRHSGIGSETAILDWSISGDTVSATSAAVYKVTVKLNNTVSNGDGVYINYVWADDQSHGDIVVTWTIEKANNPISVTMNDWTFGQSAKAPSVTAAFNQEGAKYEYYKDEACLTPAVGNDESQKPTAAGTYWVKATIAATGDYGDKAQGFADSVAKDSFTIERATLALPEIAGDEAYYTYSGGRIDVKINASYLNGGEDVAITSADQFSKYFTFSGDLNGTDAGGYELTVTLNSNYKWTAVPEGGSLDTDNLKLSWSIEQQEIALPEIYGTYSYTGNAQNVQISAMYLNEGSPFTPANETSVYFTFDGNITETDAGSDYTLIIKLSSNYKWTGIPNGGSSVTDNLSLSWSIAQAIPVIDSFTIEGWEYDSAAQSPSISVNFDGEEFNIDYSIDYVYYFDADQDGSFAENEIVEAPTNKSSAGSYKVVAKVAADESGNWIESAAKEATFTISRKKISTPKVDYSAGAVGGVQGYTYADGETIFVVVQSEELGSVKVEDAQSLAPYFTFSQNNSGVNAGGYTLSVTPTANYAWEGGTFEAKDISWNIVARVIELPTFDGGTEKESGYSRGEQSAEIVTYDEKAMIVAVSADNSANESGRFDRGTVYAAHADVYTVTVTLNNQDVTNYVWNADGTDTAEKTLTWTIDSIAVNAPDLSETSTEYQDSEEGGLHGVEQSVVLNDYNETDFKAQFTGTKAEFVDSEYKLFATEANVYTVTITLNNPEGITNYTWAEGTESNEAGAVVITWTIEKQIVYLPATSADGRRLEFTGGPQTPDGLLTENPRYEPAEAPYYEYTGGTPSQIAGEPNVYGSYYYAFVLANPGNYEWGTVPGDQTAEPDERDVIDGKTIYAWFKITKTQYYDHVTVAIEGWTYGETANEPVITLDTSSESGDPLLTEVQNAIAADTPEHNTIAYYYSGKLRNGGSYGDEGDHGTEAVPTQAGTYRLIVVIEETTNYTRTVITTVKGQKITFTISPKELTDVAWSNANAEEETAYSFTYGEAANAQLTFGGKLEQDTIVVTYRYFKDEAQVGEANVCPTDVDVYTVTADISNANYCFAEGKMSQTTDYVITPKTLTVAVTDQTVVYGEELGKWTISAEGWAYEEKTAYEADFIAALRKGISHDYRAGSPVLEGGYTATISTPELGEWTKNYTFEYNGGSGKATINVEKRKITVTIDNKTSVYGDAIAELTATPAFTEGSEQTVTGAPVYNGEKAYSLVFVDTKTGNQSVITVEVGSAAATYYIAGISANENYSITFVNGDGEAYNATYVITPATMTASPEGYSGTYDAAEHDVLQNANISVEHESAFKPTWKFSLTENANGEGYTEELKLKDVAEDGGSYKVYYIVTESNHETISGSFTVTISKAALQAYVNDATVDYGFDVANGKFEILYAGWQGTDRESADTYVNAKGATFDLGGFAVGAAQGSKFTVTVGGLTSRNYALDYTTKQGTLTVVARNITVTLNAQRQTYKGQKGSYTLGNIYGENYTAVLGTQAGTVTEWSAEASALYGTDNLNAALTVADSAKNAGSYKISFESKNKNYSVTVANAENPLFTIEKKEITVALKNDYTVIYGEAAPKLGWNNVVVTDFLDGSDYARQLGALEFTFVGYTAGTSNAGDTFTVKAKLADSEAKLNYTVSRFENGLLTVEQREVSVTVTWNNKTENAYTASVQKASAQAAGAYGVTGIIEKDAALNIADNFEYSYASTDEKGYSEALHAGAYKVSVTLGEALGKNYVLNHAAELTFTITPATVDAVWAHGDEAQTHFVYDGEIHNSEVTAEAVALGADSLTLKTSEQSGKDFKAAGDYTFVAVIASGNDFGDYVLSEGTKTLSYKMNQRQVVIRANDAEMYYGETPAIETTLGWKYASDSGINSEVDPLYQFVAGDGVAIATFTYATTATSTSHKGEYITSINENALLTNYSVTYLPGEMTVKARPIRVTIADQESEYGYDNLKALTAQAEATEESGLTGGIVNKDENVYSLSVDWGEGYDGEKTNKPVGTYTISGEALDENYKIVEFVTASYTVKKRTLTVTAQSNKVVYGDEVSGTQVEYSGFAPDEDETDLDGTLSFTYLNGETAYAPGYGVGDAGKTFTITPGGYTSGNYTFDYNTATLTVVAREITVTIGNASSVYGDEKDLYGQVKVTRGGQEENALAAGDGMQEVFGLSAYDAKGTPAEFGAKTNVDTYYIVGSDGQLKSDNYIIQFEGSASVTVGGEKEPAGTHTITARDLVLSPSIPSDNSYSGKAKEFSATVVEGGAEGEKPSVSAVYYAGHHDYSELAGLEPMASAPKDVGKYTIVFDAGSNYSTAAVIIHFEITEASVSVVWSTSGEGNYTFTYLGKEQTVSAHYELLGEDAAEENGGVKGLQISIVSYTRYGGSAITDGESLSGVTFKDAGSYKFKAAFAEGDELSKNYTLLENTVENTYTMDRAEITVTIANKTGEYGDARKELTATVTSGEIFEADKGGTLESNPVYTLSAEKVTEESSVGTYYIAGATNSEGRGFNYDIKFLGDGEASRNVALYTVTARVLIVTAEYGDGSIVYGDEIDTDLFSLTYERRNTQYGEETFVNGDQASSVTVLPAAFGTRYEAGVTGAGSTVAVTIDTKHITFENYAFVDSGESDFDVEQRVITLLGDYAAQFADLTYNGADRWLAVATKDVENLAPGETVGEDVSFDYSFTFKGSSQAEQEAIGAGEYVVTISLNEEASPNYAFDTDTVEFTIAKKALAITPDFDPATAETQNITVRYGNVLTSDYIREHYIRYDGFIDGESEQPESTDILSHIVVEQGYVYADAETRTDAGTKLSVTLRFEEDFAPDNYEVTFGQDTQIEVLKRQINIELTNEYEQNSYGYHVFGEYGKEIKPVIAQVSSGGIVEGDTESAEIAYTYYYYGASNDGTWNYSAQEAREQGISTPPDKAGTYGVIVVLASGNYELAPEDTGISEDRTTRTFENYYTILKQRVDSPKWAYSSLTATGGEQENTLEYNVSLYSYVTADSDNGNMPSVINSNGTITMRATYAGSYWVIFELNDPNNYVWRDLTGTEEGYDNPLIDIEWSISNYNDLTVTILGLDTNGDGSADLTPTAGENGALWLNGSWAYGDAFGTMIAEGKYNGGQNTFEGTISIRFYLASSSEQVTNYRNAGTYYAVASVMASSDYNAAESERVYFTISRRALAVPAAESKEYSGAAVEALLADFNGATMNIVGIAQGLSYTLRDGAYYLSAVNADTYYLNIALSDPNNYIWSGQSGSAQTVEVRWTVTPKTVQAPELAEMSKTYTGDTFSYEVAQSEYYIVRGTTSASAAGDYTVTVTLRSNTNFVWSTGGTDSLSVTWHITKAENGWQEGQDTYSRDGWTYGSAAAEETMPVPEFGSVSVKYYTDASLQNEFAGAFDEQTNAGTYYVLITVEGNDNYGGLTLGEGGTLSFTVGKASNNWIGSYAREGWTYGSDPSEETLPDADFGTVTVRYYTDASHEHEYTQGFTRTTDAGVYYVTLTVEGNNNYDGLTAQAQFEIGKATAYVVWSGGSFTYDSTDQTAKITAQFYESVATAGGYLDIAVSIQSYNGEEAADQFKEFKDAGTYVFAASLAGTDYEKNYELSGQTHEYVMQRASVTVTLSAQEAVYSGQTPEIDQKAYEVTAGSAFEEDLGIELSVEGEFVNAGTYNIEAAYSNDTNFEVTFIGAQFVISPLEIRVEITPNGGSYGNVTAAEARVTNAGGEPVSGVQVTLTYTGTMNNGEQYTGTEAPAEAGSYIVTATVESTNYRLTSAEPASFIVSKARVSVGAIGSKAYNGKLQEADISVTGAEEDVYDLINDGGKNVGNYEVLFTFKGDNAYNYVWFYNDTEVNGASLELTFSITVLRAAENPVSLDISGLDGWTYGDAAKTPSAKAKVYGEPVFYYAETENGTYTTAVPVHAGTYWVKAVVEATTNNEASSSEAKQFTIARAANGWLDGQDTYSRDGWTYGGDATAETFPVAKFGDMSVKYYTDAAHENEYTQSFGSATNAGIYYVVITVEGNTDYESLSLTGQFEVSKRGIAKPALADPADAAVETGELLHNEIAGYDGTLMQLSELEGGVSTVNGETYLTATAAGVYRITIDLSDTSNYQWADGTDGALTLTWTLRRAELTGWTAESESRYPDVIVTAAGGIHPDYVVEIATIAAERYADYDLSAYENAEIVLGYDISMTSGGASVQPEGEITVRVRVPDGFADGGYTLLHLHNGEWTEVSYTVQDGYAEFATSSLSAFMFITQETPASLVWLIVVLAVLLAVEIVLMAVAVAKRRKGRNN